jgi:hypothetical protein
MDHTRQVSTFTDIAGEFYQDIDEFYQDIDWNDLNRKTEREKDCERSIVVSKILFVDALNIC